VIETSERRARRRKGCLSVFLLIVIVSLLMAWLGRSSDRPLVKKPECDRVHNEKYMWCYTTDKGSLKNCLAEADMIYDRCERQ
jgi:hypothetical protein